MMRTIQTRFRNTHCRLCNIHIPLGGACRFDRSIKGVACLACVPETATPAATHDTLAGEVLASVTRERDALRTTVLSLEGVIRRLDLERTGLRAQIVELQRLAGITPAEIAAPAEPAAPAMRDEPADDCPI